MEQDAATREKILAYLQRVKATPHAPDGLYPELGWHRVSGSRNLLAESCVTAAAQALRMALLSNLPESRLREQAMCRLIEAYTLALHALGMVNAGEE